RLHTEVQDTTCRAWRRLLDLVEAASHDHRVVLDLDDAFRHDEDRARIVTLPPSIAKLKSVKKLSLVRSCLVRIPEEIGAMESLEEFDANSSYRLQWFPYEITRCRSLRKSRVSTRALYGNEKFRPPFPRLPPLPRFAESMRCSVCGREFLDAGVHTVWLSL